MLTHAQTRFLALDQGVAPAVFNFALNAAVGFLVFGPLQSVPTWPELSLAGLTAPNLAGDFFGMFFFLPLFTCLVVTPLVRRAAKSGKIAQLSLPADEHRLLRHLPSSSFRRGALVGLLATLGLAPCAIGLLAVLDVNALPPASAASLKGVLAAGLAGLTTPVFALYALSPPKAH